MCEIFDSSPQSPLGQAIKRTLEGMGTSHDARLILSWAQCLVHDRSQLELRLLQRV